MKPEMWQQIERLFNLALERKPDERTAFLDEACKGDDALRREVEALLAYQGQAEKFIEASALEVAARALAEDRSRAVLGQQVGAYKVLSRLGAGGMGEVYLAEDTRLDRKVAIKFLPMKSITDEQARKRFIREAQAAAKLDHPNICSIYEVGEEGGHSFIVMQYVEGETLASRIQRKPLDLGNALRVAIQIADALSEAHSHGIIHRDVKPQNVIINPRGQVKVLDFGLAKVVNRDQALQSKLETESLLSTPGMIMGTVPYMSPEQVRGLTLDGRSDIFSFGAVLYEMVSGRNPFRSDSHADTISAILTTNLPPLEGAPDELQQIVSRCIEKDREHRYQTMRDIATDLGRLRRGFDSGELTSFQDKQSTASVAAANTHSEVRWTEALTPGRALAIAAIVIVLIMAALAYMLFFRSPSTERPPEIRSLAVLPFKSLNSETSDDYLGLGIGDTIITRVSQIDELIVRPTSAVRKYADQQIDSLEAARQLKVDAVLDGTVRRAGDRLRVSVNLLRVSDGASLWAESFDLASNDVFTIEDRVSQQVAAWLRLRLSPTEQARLTKRYTLDSEAYQLYLKGRYHWSKLTLEGVQKGIEYFRQAIKEDPNYALAYAGLADCYTYIAKPADAKTAAMRAIEIDDTLGEAHASLAFFKFLYDWDFIGSEIEFKRAFELNPNYAVAHHWYAVYLANLGRHDEAILEARRAQELDPLSLIINVTSGMAFYLARQYDRAAAELQGMIAMEPNFAPAHSLLARAYEQKGMYKEALAEYQKTLGLLGENATAKAAIKAAIARFYAASGKRSEAMKTVNELSKQSDIFAYSIAVIYAALDENDLAFQWLEKAYKARDVQMVGLKVDPHLDSLRSDPRFADLLRRIGLAP